MAGQNDPSLAGIIASLERRVQELERLWLQDVDNELRQQWELDFTLAGYFSEQTSVDKYPKVSGRVIGWRITASTWGSSGTTTVKLLIDGAVAASESFASTDDTTLLALVGKTVTTDTPVAVDVTAVGDGPADLSVQVWYE